jgi:dynein light chain LC8-type
MVKGEKRYFKDLAEFIKKAFDEKFQGTWHVIVGILTHLTQGLNFGAYVSYESKCFIHFWINQIGFLIYKFG